MPRVSGARKLGEYVALEIMEVGKAVTPSEIDMHVGRGNYASKYISFLKRDGHEITANKDGRQVVSYTLVKLLPQDKWPAGAFEKPAKEKAVKAPKAKKEKAVKPKAEKKAKAKKTATKAKTKIVVPAVDMTIPAKKVVSGKAAAKKVVKEETPVMDTGEFGQGSYSVDNTFDDFEVDVSKLA